MQLIKSCFSLILLISGTYDRAGSSIITIEVDKLFLSGLNCYEIATVLLYYTTIPIRWVWKFNFLFMFVTLEPFKLIICDKSTLSSQMWWICAQFRNPLNELTNVPAAIWDLSQIRVLDFLYTSSYSHKWILIESHPCYLSSAVEGRRMLPDPFRSEWHQIITISLFLHHISSPIRTSVRFICTPQRRLLSDSDDRVFGWLKNGTITHIDRICCCHQPTCSNLCVLDCHVIHKLLLLVGI